MIAFSPTTSHKQKVLLDHRTLLTGEGDANSFAVQSLQTSRGRDIQASNLSATATLCIPKRIIPQSKAVGTYRRSATMNS